MTPHLTLTLGLALLVAVPAHGQSVMEGSRPGAPANLLPMDSAVLEGREMRRDLPCAVTPISPELGFDLGFHSGYEVAVPVRELAGTGTRLTAVFRVTPGTGVGKPVYFIQKWTVPPIEDNARGTAHLRGEFALGEGTYRVDWLMRDLDERFCTMHWQILAGQRGKDRHVELRLPAGTARSEAPDPFTDEEVVTRASGRLLNVVVLLHVAPQTAGAVGLRASETTAPVAIVRGIAREPRIGTYSITVFNLEQRKILYRMDDTPAIDFPALGKAIKQLHLGTVEVQQLIDKDNRAQFLRGVVAEQLRNNRPDALIFVGPKTIADSFALSRSLKELGDPRCPVFYLNYDASPATNPWQDLIGSVVKLWKGKEYTITRPRDLSTAWAEVMSRFPDNLPMTDVITNLVPKK